MSKQSKPSPSANPPASRPSPGATGNDDSRSAPVSTHDQIAARAYEIFIARGQQHGRDLEDWQQAESELRLGKQ